VVETFSKSGKRTNKAVDGQTQKKPRENWENLVCGHPATHQVFMGPIPQLQIHDRPSAVPVCVCGRNGVDVCVCAVVFTPYTNISSKFKLPQRLRAIAFDSYAQIYETKC